MNAVNEIILQCARFKIKTDSKLIDLRCSCGCDCNTNITCYSTRWPFVIPICTVHKDLRTLFNNSLFYMIICSLSNFYNARNIKVIGYVIKYLMKTER